MPKQETILFAPLNWGLGHATRIVPLVKEAVKNGHKVILAADGAAFRFFRSEFPELLAIKLKGFNIKYWPKPFFNLGLFTQLPLFYVSMFFENIRVRKLIRKHGITKIVSDNRYGVRGRKTKNILITHQLFIKVPKLFKAFEPLVHSITNKLIYKFDECWVPDYAEIEKSLAGELSHGNGVPANVKYIGPLSRFQNFILQKNMQLNEFPEILILISGPEPARTVFEKQMEERFRDTEWGVLMVCGKPGNYEEVFDGNIKKVSHLSTEELYQHLKNCKQIIARSGYSTIMDLHVLEREAELSPTPGQSEQEYLTEWLFHKAAQRITELPKGKNLATNEINKHQRC